VNILAILRMVPDPAGELQIAEDGASLDREWLDFQLNDFDDHALEEAILVKEAAGGRVIAACLGEGANRTLQMAAAKGADEVIAVDTGTDGMISSRALAHAFAGLAKTHSVDLVVSGVQSSEDLFGQLVPYLGGLLGWPHVSGTSQVSLQSGHLAVTQERGGGVAATWKVTLPAILGVQTASKSPRYVSGSKLREGARIPIAKQSAGRSGFSIDTGIRSLAGMTRGNAAEPLGSDAEEVADRLVELLSGRNLLKGAA
jgi:electron transfer flavoprotein beta subunit